MVILSLDEITDGYAFEELVAAYFKVAKDYSEFNVLNVDVRPTGSGSDGGRDILVDILVDDSIKPFKRKWVIQCKFYEQDVSKAHLSAHNIPTLLHEYGADGYLLVCKNGVTSPVSRMIEGLNDNCRFNRSYVFWTGRELIHRINLRATIIETFFPKYAAFLKTMEP